MSDMSELLSIENCRAIERTIKGGEGTFEQDGKFAGSANYYIFLTKGKILGAEALSLFPFTKVCMYVGR